VEKPEKRTCRTNILPGIKTLCMNEPTAWVEWADPNGGGVKSRESEPICSACAEHLKKYARRKGLERFLHFEPLEQVRFPF
jgi:hypothetical protein